MSRIAAQWTKLGAQFLPFADAATKELPLGRLLRLSLFQISVGMAAVLLTGTLNRVMIVELKMSSALVAAMVALPLLFAPLRALIGFKSDTHRSLLGWKRVPYIWFGSLLQFGGLAIMPFALLVMAGDGVAPAWQGEIFAAIAFLMVGAGMHTTQTAGLALATDLAPQESRPRVVALLYVMLLAGMLLSSVLIGSLLQDFTSLKLIQIIQGAAALTMLLNIAALWKQEARNALATAPTRDRPDFAPSWKAFVAPGSTRRLLVSVGLGAAAFAMQDVLLEPYGGEVLGLGVGQTTLLTALWASGTLAGLALAARQMGRGHDGEPHRLAGLGVTAGIFAFACVLLSAPIGSVPLFCVGVVGVGFGAGLFSVGTLIAAMGLADESGTGLALGAWGAVQASCAGGAILIAGLVREAVAAAAANGSLGTTLMAPATSYSLIYLLEIALLFATLVALGPLARRLGAAADGPARPFGLTEFPV